MVQVSSVAVSGSSPHTRGARRVGRVRVQLEGDHPRIRGEHLAQHEVLDDALGIIPAYAGSTR